MKPSNALATELRLFAAEIGPDSLSCIDFDKLRDTITRAAATLEESAAVSADLAALRSDYEARIAGMLKAISAVARTRSGREEAVDTALDLSSKSAIELLECYRRAAARFRDNFPSSFGLLQGTTPSRGLPADKCRDFL